VLINSLETSAHHRDQSWSTLLLGVLMLVIGLLAAISSARC
jgi:uncharacterized membrane protein HdeD (DUF308 family)